MQTKGPSMRAAVLAGPEKMRVEEVPIPEPGEGAVRVRVEGCGVCGSNLAPWEGRSWFKYPFAPGAPGHEGWGVIDAIGPNVGRFQVGDRVAMLSYHAFAEYDVAKENTLFRLPESLKGKPFPGEALGCAINVFRRSDIQMGDTVAVIGIGFLGAVVTALAAQAGAYVIAISRRPFALEVARKFGADETIMLADHACIIEQVQKLTEGQGCDRVIEATGQQGPLDLAGELTRQRGRMVVAGYHQEPRQINMQLWNWRGLDVINAHERDVHVYLEGMEAAVDALNCGHLDWQSLYTHTFSLDQIGSAFEAMQERPTKFLKALIVI